MTIDNNRLRGIGLYIGDKTSYYLWYCVYIVTPGYVSIVSYRYINIFTSILISTLFLQETLACEYEFSTVDNTS